MVNWLAWEAIATSVLVLTSAGAISYAGLQLANERKYRSVSNLEKQLSFFLSASFALARTQLAHDRVNAAGLVALDIHEPPVSAFEVLDFYEHLGLLVKKGHLDVYDVWHTFYEWAQPVYLDLRPLIENNESPYSEQYSDLRKLMRQMDDIQLEKMHLQKSNHWALWTPERIMEHYRYELETGGLRRRMIRRQRKQEAREDAAAVSAPHSACASWVAGRFHGGFRAAAASERRAAFANVECGGGEEAGRAGREQAALEVLE